MATAGLFSGKFKGKFALMVMVFFAWGCRKAPTKENGQPLSDPNEDAMHGEAWIGIDETIRPIMEEQVLAYSATYPDAKVHPIYAPEAELSRLFIADSVRLIIVGRDFLGAEIQSLKALSITPKTTPIFKDAIVVAVHPSNPVKYLTNKNLRDIFHGAITSWQALHLAGAPGEIQLVFEGKGSGILRQTQEVFLGQDSLKAKAFEAGNVDTLIDFVSKSPNAMGFFGFNAISDKEDPIVKARMEKIAVMRLEVPDSAGGPNLFVQPFQSEISTGAYPLLRKINALSREHFMGVGTGFVIYVAGDKGQRMILKEGLVPAFMPPREIRLPE